jgi:hypothetical protein
MILNMFIASHKDKNPQPQRHGGTERNKGDGGISGSFVFALLALELKSRHYPQVGHACRQILLFPACGREARGFD